MRMRVTKQITVNAPASKVWRILAHEFDRIDQWASSVTKSSALANISVPEGAKVGGRAFSSPVFGDVQEAFTYYDEQAMRFGYAGLGKSPSFIKQSENNWRVQSLDANTSLVETRPDFDLKLFPGLFMMPVLEIQIWWISSRMLEEFKYYVEHDQPHPRKLK